MYGWTNPFPMKYGAEKGSRLEEIVNALLDNQGTALSKDYESYNFVLAHAAGRLLNELFAANEALSHITDPYKMPIEFVERFEKIFNLYANPEDSLNMRRARIALHIFFFGKTPNFTTINDFLSQAIPNIYVGIVNTYATEGTLYIPGGGSVPGGGPVFLDGNDLEFSPWTGGTCFMAIQLKKPNGMPDHVFYEQVGEIQLLDPLLPIWMTFDWFQDGPNGAGFYLDEDFNLDNQRF
jgi:hypothetical protein